MHTPKTPRYVLASFVTLALLAGQAPAQVAPATPEATPAKSDKVTKKTNEQGEEVVQLSPFQVNASKDNGYLATNATSGTRLNAAIKDLPLNLEVITNDFMRDTGRDQPARSAALFVRHCVGVAIRRLC